LLADSEVEMASICPPRPTHPDLAVACAWADIHCLIEKPMAVDLQGVAQTVWIHHASQSTALLLTVDQ
jgi:predicted dehydrogenase